ncbi:MAG TPA: hypothetical protein ENN85_07185 [Methanoculleus sp.]|nr:hypothetical protein [Methanoculleus sp.]
MKHSATVLILILLLAPAASAAVQGAGYGGDGAGQQVEQHQQQEMANASGGESIRAREYAQNGSELQQMVRDRQQAMTQPGEQVTVQDRDRVRLAAYAFTAAQALAGEHGPRLCEHAQQINASVQVTERAEERIRTRSSVVRFFLGGDAASADAILQQVEQNRNRIQEMNRLLVQCECDDETRAVLQEQLRNIEEEQNRLHTLAREEQQDRGLFGWLL